MQNAPRFVDDEALPERLKDAFSPNLPRDAADEYFLTFDRLN
jgi:hypothetical protein